MKEKIILADFLSKKNLRMTPQRELILNAFLKTERHLSSEELYSIVKRKDSSIGQATVYRMLRLLADSGLAREVDFGDGVIRYEHKYGHGHHDHLICERCRKNIEILDDRIEELQERIVKKHGFKLTGHKMYLYGICSDCSSK